MKGTSNFCLWTRLWSSDATKVRRQVYCNTDF